MRSLSKILTVLVLGCLCSYSQTKEDVVAKINGEAILRSELDKAESAIVEQYSELSPDFLTNSDSKKQIKKMAFDKIESETLIKQEAAKLNIKVSEREIDNGISEIKSRFSIDSKGNRLNEQQTEKYFMEELKRQNISFDEFRARIRKDLMARKLIDQTIKPKINPPNHEELKKFYDNLMLVVNGDTQSLKASKEEMEDYLNIANKLKEMFSERIRLRHILIKPQSQDLASKTKAFEKAKNIRQKLLKGEDFEEIAQKESEDKESAKRGGDIGYAIKGMLPEQMEKTAFSINPGEISDIIETPFGYHIIQVTEKKIAQKIKFELVKDDISNIMMQQKFADELQKYVEELKKKAKIEIFDPSLK